MQWKLVQVIIPLGKIFRPNLRSCTRVWHRRIQLRGDSCGYLWKGRQKACNYISQLFCIKTDVYGKRTSGETGATDHVITRINSNVCLVEINSKPARNCQEKHGNFSSIVENHSIRFISTLDKIFNFVCGIFVCRLVAFFVANLLFKMCVIFKQSDSMYSFRDCHTTSRPLHISYFYVELEHLILQFPLIACKSYSTKMTQFLKFSFLNRTSVDEHRISCSWSALSTSTYLCLDSIVALRNMANFSRPIRSQLPYCLILDSFFGNHFCLLINRFCPGWNLCDLLL